MTDQDYYDKCSIAAMQAIVAVMYRPSDKAMLNFISDEAHKLTMTMLEKRQEQGYNNPDA